jgi:hypothetical protein
VVEEDNIALLSTPVVDIEARSNENGLFNEETPSERGCLESDNFVAVKDELDRSLCSYNPSADTLIL